MSALPMREMVMSTSTEASVAGGEGLRLARDPVVVGMTANAGRGAGSSEGAGSMSLGELTDLMRAFTETTDRLQRTHVALHGQVAQLQSELAEANAQLRRTRSLAALGEMAAGIAHEVRNPLGSIQLYVQLLSEDLRDRPSQVELCGKIERAVTGLDAIVRDVLSFARNTTVRPEHVQSDVLLERALGSCDSLLLKSDVRVVGLAGESHHVRVDSCLLNQALGNIVRNAIEAMRETPVPQGGHALAVGAARRRVRCPDGQRAWRIVLWIQDTGHGIPDEILARMFNPFFTTRPTGTGLGLAIVHRIIDAHGGHIGVTRVPGGGTRFELYLPPEGPAQNSTSSANGTSGLAPCAGEGRIAAMSVASAQHNRFASEAES